MNRSEYDAERYRRNKEKILARQKEYYRLNKNKIIAKMRVYQKKNQAAFTQYHAQRYIDNPDRYAADRKRWRLENPGRATFHVRLRQARQLRATPKWANLEEIKRIYDRASELTRQTGTRWTVDHIYPLKSRLVCGLHTEANLQILTLEANSRKGNRMPEDAK